MKAHFDGYDLIVAHRVLDVLYDPQLFIHQMLGRLNQGGILLLSSAYQWSEALTPKQKWLGGFKANGENQTSETHLKQVLAVHSELLTETEVISDVQLDSRSSQRQRNHLTLWKKH